MAEGNELPSLTLLDLLEEPPTPDLNGSGVMDVQNLLILLSQWGPCPETAECLADLNCDGAVDVLDLLILLAEWEPLL